MWDKIVRALSISLDIVGKPVSLILFAPYYLIPWLMDQLQAAPPRLYHFIRRNF